MKIVMSYKLFGLISSIPLPCKAMRNDLETAKKHNLVSTEQDMEGVSIYLNEEFVYDILSAIISTVAPLAGLFGSGVYLINQLGERFDEIGNKYVPKEKKEYATNNIADPNFKIDDDEEDDW